MRSFRRLLLPVLFILLPSLGQAGDADLEKDLQKKFSDSKVVLKKILKKQADGQDLSLEISQLKNLSEEILPIHLLLEERFRLREEATSNLGGTAATRNRLILEGYREALEEYLVLIGGLSQEGDPSPMLQALEELLHRLIPERSTPFWGSLPYRSLRYPALRPLTFPLILPAYRGGNKTVSPEDLEATPEAPLSEAIARHAESLDWNPVSIYEWVKNNVETEWLSQALF